MHINKLKPIKPVSKEGIIYSSSFVIYVIVLVFIFISATKFLSLAINTALSSPVGEDITAKYGQLDLTNYALVANKLDLKRPVTNATTTLPVASVELASTSTENLPSVVAGEATSVPLVTASNTPTEVASTTPTTTDLFALASTTPPVQSAPVDIKPTIAVVNSTLKSGLASDLKKLLVSGGFNVIKTSTIKPSTPNTIILIKASLNPDSAYLAQIKKIVGNQYDFVLGILDETSDHGVEIVIGNK